MAGGNTELRELTYRLVESSNSYGMEISQEKKIIIRM